jgi:hypothetical protein
LVKTRLAKTLRWLLCASILGCNAILDNEAPYLRDSGVLRDASSDAASAFDARGSDVERDVAGDSSPSDTRVPTETGTPDSNRGDSDAGTDAGSMPDVSIDASDGRDGRGGGDAIADGGQLPDSTLDGPSLPDADGGSRDADGSADDEGGPVPPPDSGPDIVDAGCDDPIACTPEAPRLLAPLSTGRVTSRQPTLRWNGSVKAQRYRVELCAEPACTTVRETIQTTTTTARPTTALPAASATFWRVHAHNGAFSATSITWVFFVGVGNSSVDTSWLGPPDFDGNGSADVALGSASAQAFLMMNHNGLPTVPSQTLTGAASFGISTANAGDVNGDGKGDFLVGTLGSGIASVFFGNASGVDSNPRSFGPATSNFGAAVGGVGDLNGDGYADVALGGTGSNAISNVYLGGPTGVGTTAWSAGLTGSPVSGAGDVNGDGYSDLIVCSVNSGNATVYLFNAAGIFQSQMIPMPPGETTFGESCIGAGDVNGDGYADVVVSTFGLTSAFVFYGSAGGIQQTGYAELPGGGGSYTGAITSIAPAGDVNADGYDDVIVGAYNTNRVLVYHGSAMGIATIATTSFDTLPANGQFGFSVAAAGDANGDGYADIAFASGQCTGYDVYVHAGSASGVITSPSVRTWTAPAGTQCMGIIAR